MSASCCGPAHDHGAPSAAADAPYRRVLWLALAVNVLMFAVEVAAGLTAGSTALLADSLDFLGDAANYGVSLFVLGLALRWRAGAALLKAASMAAFGIWVAGTAIYYALAGTLPDAQVMGVVGVLALIANLGVALLLFRHRDGDSNRRSVWICTRNDALGNLAVLAAALGVFGTGTFWPDFIVAASMAGLALWGAMQVMRQAVGELRSERRRIATA